jgi:hypothetical protein
VPSDFDPTPFLQDGDTFDSDDVLIRARVRIEFSALGEGLDGDYDPADPEDVELLRFDFYGLLDGASLTALDASYCTQVPAATPGPVKRALLAVLADTGAQSVESGLGLLIQEHDGDRSSAAQECEFHPESRRTFERLSWITPAAVGYEPEGE